MSTTYHVAEPNGTRHGQMDAETVADKLASGELPADTLIWTEGMVDWQPASALCPPAVNAVSWGIMSALKSVFISRYCNFRGRASRAEFWYAYLGVFLFSFLYSLVGGILTAPLFSSSGKDDVLGVVLLYLPLILFILYAIIPGIALMVRRLHDIGMSGWFYLLGLVPYVGGLFLFVCALLPSAGPNRWGARADDPTTANNHE